MARTVRTNFDRSEARRDRRTPLPPLVVTVAETDYTTSNWSLGGFLLDPGPEIAIGAAIAGCLRLEGIPSRLDFTAEAVRRSAPSGVGFRFTDLSLELVGALDRVIANRLRRRA